MVTEARGRDPLGLSRVANLITETLLHGIITQTNRARYFSLFPWIIWHIDKCEHPRTYGDYVRCFQRREAMATFSTLLADPHSSPVGVTAAKELLVKAEGSGEADTQVRVLPSSELGGYGQYYSGCVYNLGFTSQDEQGIDHVTEGIATKIAESFDAAVRQSPYIADGWFRKRRVPLGVLQASADAFSIDSVSKRLAKPERQLLIDRFFALDSNKHGPLDRLRMETLSHLLFLIRAYQEAGIPVEAASETEQLVYGPCYYGVLVQAGKDRRTMRPPAALVRCQLQWQDFCLQQYVALALERLLWAVLETAAGETFGLRPRDIVSRITGRDFEQALNRIVRGGGRSPTALLAAVGKQVGRRQGPSGLERGPGWGDELSEHGLSSRPLADPSEATAVACVSLAVLFVKWRELLGRERFLGLIERAGNELWAGNVLPFLDPWSRSQLTWPQAIDVLVDRLIVQQHDRVMYEKHRLDTCWLSWVEDRLCKEQDHEPNWRSSRREQATRILIDLGLLEIDEADVITITEEGLAISNRALELPA